MLEYVLLAVSPGDFPELAAYLVAHGDMVYFVLADPKPHPRQRYIIGYPRGREYMAARFRSNWQYPATDDIPALIIQRIQEYDTQS